MNNADEEQGKKVASANNELSKKSPQNEVEGKKVSSLKGGPTASSKLRTGDKKQIQTEKKASRGINNIDSIELEPEDIKDLEVGQFDSQTNVTKKDEVMDSKLDSLGNDAKPGFIVSCIKCFFCLNSRYSLDQRDDYMEMEKRFCSNCNIDQPIRSKHCKNCKICVATFDHHCIWIGNCIGEKNKWLFFVFLISQIVTLVLSIWSIFDDCMEANVQFYKWMNDHVMTMFVLLLIVAFLVNVCI